MGTVLFLPCTSLPPPACPGTCNANLFFPPRSLQLFHHVAWLTVKLSALVIAIQFPLSLQMNSMVVQLYLHFVVAKTDRFSPRDLTTIEVQQQGRVHGHKQWRHKQKCKKGCCTRRDAGYWLWRLRWCNDSLIVFDLWAWRMSGSQWESSSVHSLQGLQVLLVLICFDSVEPDAISMNCVGYCAGTFVFRIGSPKSKHKKLKNERAIHLPKSVWREVHGVAFGKQFVGLLKLFWLICSLRANSPGKVKFFTKKCVSRRLRQNIQEGWVDKWKRMQPWRYSCGHLRWEASHLEINELNNHYVE
jgi:hypothetical protein